MKWGIAGLSSPIALTFLKGFRESSVGELVGITDPDRENGQVISQRYSIPHYADFTALLAEVDAVLVFTETAYRPEVIRSAATLGKHVFCDPPFALTIEEARLQTRLCQEQGIVLESVFPLRFTPSVQRVKTMIETGQLGRVVAIRGNVRNPRPEAWNYQRSRSGGGAVFSGALPAIDLMRWLVDDELHSVYAEIGTRFSDTDIDDCALLMFDFERGAIGSLDPSWARPNILDAEGDLNFEVIGTSGVVRLRVFGQELSVFSDRNRLISSRFWGDHPVLKALEAYESRIRAVGFLQNVENAGMRAMEVSNAAYQSATSGQPVAVKRM